MDLLSWNYWPVISHRLPIYRLWTIFLVTCQNFVVRIYYRRHHNIESQNMGKSSWYWPGSFCPYWLDFLILEGTMHNTGGRKLKKNKLIQLWIFGGTIATSLEIHAHWCNSDINVALTIHLVIWSKTCMNGNLYNYWDKNPVTRWLNH